MTRPFDWRLIQTRFESGESLGQISRSLGGHPSKQAISKRARKEDWEIYGTAENAVDLVDAPMSLLTSGQWGKCTPENKARVVNALREGATFKIAAALIGISDRTLRDWRKDDPAFAAMCEAAQAEDMAETMATLKRMSRTDANIAKFRASRHRLTRDEYGSDTPAHFTGNTFNVLAGVDLGIKRD
jgi:transposase-like protein